ncbi:peptidoglycan D,D-transpeptidase FtsI family protein [Bifidobacterium platyrrhinorum]|uniref:Penicillin-binding protein 2 n=1 Tax=Bifidobacterium platyrrhinorum TaxID=2661628 RepID=A0A6L9SU25_9BIFI|nr:penicillin-binding transpeptidase domain-containing protein [Bifidobacterium platyrrhinorum]NEG56088.1 penicillin-binding protein 2 [Bifidobacterium platyrrhinorum]
MNKGLRQLFTAVIVLFTILGLSTTIITAIRATALNADTRNSRALYHEFGAPRGSILAADGTVLAKSDPSNDAFSYQRSYSNGPLYAPVTGFFSISQRADRGIEASRNSLLSGESDSLFWQRIKSTLTGSENKGANIETSIDTKLQQVAYEALGSQSGAVVVTEPKTGRILAMVSTPSYDPNVLTTHDGKALTENYANLTQDPSNPMLDNSTGQLFPPGSTFKTVVAATALETGEYQPDTQIPAGESYTLPGTITPLTNVEYQANGTDGKISFEDALAYSSNTAFAQLGVSLGEDKIADMATKLGFGSSIVVDGTDSTGSPMKAVASSFPTSMTDDKLALASIGQGDVTETPLQNALIASAIANDGKLMRPTLVDRVRASDLSVLSETKASVMSNAFSADTANKLTQMMQAVVTKDSPSLAPDGVSVAAKTGTAQIGEDNSAIDAWVMGFAPADDPQVAVSVVVHNTTGYGVTSAGPIFRSVVEEALKQ